MKTKTDSDNTIVTRDMADNATICGLVKITNENQIINSSLPGTSKTSSEKIEENGDTDDSE